MDMICLGYFTREEYLSFGSMEVSVSLELSEFHSLFCPFIPACFSEVVRGSNYPNSVKSSYISDKVD